MYKLSKMRVGKPTCSLTPHKPPNDYHWNQWKSGALVQMLITVPVSPFNYFPSIVLKSVFLTREKILPAFTKHFSKI